VQLRHFCQRGEVSWWGGWYEGNGAYKVKEWEKVLLKTRFLWGPSLSDRMSVTKRSYVSCALLIQEARQGLYKSNNDL